MNASITYEELKKRLESVPYEQLSPQKWRTAILKIYKDTLKEEKEKIRLEFENREISGYKVVTSNSDVMDYIIQTLMFLAHNYVFKDNGNDITVLAVGGYGRREMAPFSDVDLLFIIPKNSEEKTKPLIEFILYFLWDIRLKVGQAVRTIDECIEQGKKDYTIRTNLLEARMVWGNIDTLYTFQHRYWHEVVSGSGKDFVEAKLLERDVRHNKTGNSRYVLEPDIKECRGGLRDLHIIFWLAKYLFGITEMPELIKKGVMTEKDVSMFIKAHEFLMTIRCHLHYIAGRGEDHLTFDYQKEIAQKTGYSNRPTATDVERFMKHYYYIAKSVGDLTRIICSVLEEQNKGTPKLQIPPLLFRSRNIKGMVIDGHRLNVTSKDIFSEEPLKILRLFQVAHEYQMHIHPNTLKMVTESLKLVSGLKNDKEANDIFMEMLLSDKNPEKTLRRMSESGVLARFIPEFGKITAQMQYDMYHVYTTDEHSIRAVGILSDIENDKADCNLSFASEIVKKIQSRKALYTAVLLHDIAKGRKGDHSELGAEEAYKICPRLGLNEEETETVSWLIKHHLDMNRTAYKRDISDNKTIEDFVKTVQSPERLRLLFILTCADTCAVGPDVWSGWKSALLKELYYRCEEKISGSSSGANIQERVAQKKKAVEKELTGWKNIDSLLSYDNYSYWLTFEHNSLMKHAKIIKRYKENRTGISFEVNPEQSVTDVIVYTPAHAGLFSQIAGAMALSGASIVDAKIFTLPNGMALDIFSVQDTGTVNAPNSPFSDDKKLETLKKEIEKAVNNTEDTKEKVLQKRNSTKTKRQSRAFKVASRVLIDNEGSKTHTIIEVNGKDCIGFLYEITRTLKELDLQISSAHISTYGNRVVDVFYVKDIFGMKIEHKGKLKQISVALKEVLNGLSL